MLCKFIQDLCSTATEIEVGVIKQSNNFGESIRVKDDGPGAVWKINDQNDTG